MFGSVGLDPGVEVVMAPTQGLRKNVAGSGAG